VFGEEITVVCLITDVLTGELSSLCFNLGDTRLTSPITSLDGEDLLPGDIGLCLVSLALRRSTNS
jgi:hypothetical protein